MAAEGRSKRRKVAVANEGPKDTFARIMEPISTDTFFSEYWEKKHILLKKPSVAKTVGFDFKLETLWILIQEKQLRYEKHLNVCSCNDGENQKMHDGNGGVVALGELKALWNNEKTTIQFFHPQCYCDDIYKVLYELEDEFDCLWGSNVYLTPAGSQGLAPHYDDSEVFVIQTEGKKKWFLYENTDKAEELCLESSLPLPKERVGKLVAEYVLEEGDVLYLPRGTIHCARAVDDEISVHVTISTYQRHSLSNFTSDAITSLLETLTEEEKTFRSGLPVGYRSNQENSVSSLRSALASSFRKLADLLDEAKAEEKRDEVEEEIVDDIKEGMALFAVDFMENRLPPPKNGTARKVYMDSLPQRDIKAGDRVRLINPKWIHFLLCDFDSGFNSDEEDEEASENKPQEPTFGENELKIIRIYNCLDNSRENHMGLNSAVSKEEPEGRDGEDDEDFEPEPKFISAEIDSICCMFVESLKRSYPEYVEVTKDVLGFAKVLNEANTIMLLE